MKIAHVLPLSVTYPLSSPNGRYAWVAQLAQLQATAGHDVTIYCNPASQLNGIRTAGITSAGTDKKQNNIETFQLALRNDHDIYHSHFDNLHYEVADLTTRPIVATQHWWPTEETIRLANTSSTNVWAVPPTRYMYDFDTRSGIRSKGFIYHGIDLNLFRNVTAPKNDRLLFVGRISPEKNLDLVIDVARRTGYGLDIIGKITDKNQELWERLRPVIDGEHIQYLGTKTHQELVGYYASARALIFPSTINEAFGLVAIESQACGTPIIMMRGGSRGELLDEGTTGYLCETVEEFTDAARRAGSLKPDDCVRFAGRFNIRDMTQKYVALYEELLRD